MKWMRLTAAALGVVATLGVAAVTPATAQEVALGSRAAAYPEAFGMIGGLRELSDGSVLVADPLGGQLVRLDPGLTTARRMGAEGEGPGEYRQPDAIWAFGDDRSLLVDLGNARLTIIEPDGTMGEDTPIARAGEGGPGGMLLMIPGGSDASGHIYFAASGMGPAGPRDSVELYRVDPWSGGPETVTMLKAPELKVVESGAANNRSVSARPVPLGPEDTWGVAPDGGVFVARTADYHVEYHPQGGSVRTGPPMQLRPVPIGTEEKVEWDDVRARTGGVGVMVQVENGRQRVSMNRSTGNRSDLNALPWPTTKPPFENAPIRVDAGGNGWVRRSLPAGEAALYDVFDRQGRHVRSVRLPEDRTLVGFGDGVVFVARIDEFDQQFLEKYPMP